MLDRIGRSRCPNEDAGRQWICCPTFAFPLLIFSLLFSAPYSPLNNFILSAHSAESDISTSFCMMAGKGMAGKKGCWAGNELPSAHTAMLMHWEEAASSASVLFPLLAQDKPCCCSGAGGSLVFLLLPEPRLIALPMAAVERSCEGQGHRARDICLRRCLCKQKMQVLGKWGKGPEGSALMRLWGVQRACLRCKGLLL